MQNIHFTTLGLAMILTATGAAAADPVPNELGTSHDWTAYALPEGKNQICFVVADPNKSEPAAAKRDKPHLLVTHRPPDKQYNVVSAELGFDAAKGSSASLTVGKDKFDMFTDAQTAWTRDADTDKAVVDALIKGKELTVQAKSARGTAVTDTYSLAGFGDALKLADKACKVKR
jgi:invasion protein IalB